jgi:hypothetical protein
VRILIVGVAWLALVSVLHAQPDWAAVQQLAAGSIQVRVEAGNRRASGSIHRVTDSEIAIRNAYGDIAHFNRQDVQRIEQVVGPSGGRKRGMIIGFLAGAGLSAIATLSSGERGDKRRHELPLIYGVTMGGGALLGALLAESDRTHVIYTR